MSQNGQPLSQRKLREMVKEQQASLPEVQRTADSAYFNEHLTRARLDALMLWIEHAPWYLRWWWVLTGRMALPVVPPTISRHVEQRLAETATAAADEPLVDEVADEPVPPVPGPRIVIGPDGGLSRRAIR